MTTPKMRERPIKLLPCPFCGNAKLSEGSKCFGHGDYGKSITCECGAEMSHYYGGEVKRWNTRTYERQRQLEQIIANARRFYHHYSQPNADKTRITTDLSQIIQSLEKLAARAALGEGRNYETN